MRRIHITFLFILLVLTANTQVLDVPARRDAPRTSNWCQPRTCQNIIVYYGIEVQVCEIIDFQRFLYPDIFGSQSCCLDPLPPLCDHVFYHSEVTNTLMNWGLDATEFGRPLEHDELTTAMVEKRPFFIRIANSDNTGGHAMTGYGYYYAHLYIHDSRGSLIVSLNAAAHMGGPYNDGRQWRQSVLMDYSAVNCPTKQNITGFLEGHFSKYKALQEITANCKISSYGSKSSSITFLSAGYVTLNSGFEVNIGSSLTINTGVSLSCP